MRHLVLLAFVFALPAAAQEAPEVAHPNRCVVQNATGPAGTTTLQIHLASDGKVFVEDETVATSEITPLVARHLAEAGAATVRFEQERGTPHRYAEALLASIKAGYAEAGASPRIAFLIADH